MKHSISRQKILLYFSLLLFSACGGGNSSTLKPGISYHLSEPDKKFKLPGKLREISGLSAISNEKVACVQDEVGKIYVFHLDSEEVEKPIDFATHGDYEEMAIVGNDAFVLRSDGVIFEVKNWESGNMETDEFTTSLSAKNNAEGLCYDSTGNRLLIACKGKAGEGKEFRAKKAIYAFDLQTKKFQDEPIFLLSLQQINDSLKNSTVEKTIEFMREEDNVTFQPSGIAIHPFTNEIYVISSTGKALVILNRDGQIMHVGKLNPAVFKQPEGITFLPNGDMLISNEGQGGDANILWFKYRK